MTNDYIKVTISGADLFFFFDSRVAEEAQAALSDARRAKMDHDARLPQTGRVSRIEGVPTSNHKARISIWRRCQGCYSLIEIGDVPDDVPVHESAKTHEPEN